MVFESSPEVLDVVVLFKLAGAFNVLYSVLMHPFTDLGDYHGVDSLVLVLLKDGDQQGVDSVVFPQSLEDVNETEGEHVALRFLERTKGAADEYIMVTVRGYASFPLNILYAFVVLFLVYCLYNIINLAIVTITGAADTVPLGVEPILFGLFYLGFDLLLIRLKHLLFGKTGKKKA